MPNLLTAEICTVADHYAAMYESLADPRSRGNAAMRAHEISNSFFAQICKMRYTGWKHRVSFNRGRKPSLPEVFQDLVAFYLRAALPAEFEICVERPVKAIVGGLSKSICPDITIKLAEQTHFIIEAKTTIGWARPDYKLDGEDAYWEMERRIQDLAEAYQVDRTRIIFIFQEPSNVCGTQFLPKFWDKISRTRNQRPVGGVLSHVYPLFADTDPSKWKWNRPKGRTSADWCPDELPDSILTERVRHSIVTPFEEIVKLIKTG